jgi:hypothetical protein
MIGPLARSSFIETRTTTSRIQVLSRTEYQQVGPYKDKPMPLDNSKTILTFLMMIGLTLSLASGSEISIPERSDWSTAKEIIGLRLGPQGSWDDFHPGANTPCTIVNLSGTYYLY